MEPMDKDKGITVDEYSEDNQKSWLDQSSIKM